MADSWSGGARAAAAIVLALLVTLSVRVLPFAYDDAYIHFRIAEHLAQHGQPFFNLGEPVMATSSPVWTLVLGGLGLLGLRLPLTVAVLNPLLTMAGALVWTRALIELRGGGGRLGAALFGMGYVGLLLPAAVGLMETPLALLLLGAGALQLWRGRAFGWAFIGVAVFTRLELTVFVPFLAAATWHTQEPSLPQHALALGAPVALLAAITLAAFGTLLPHTVAAKQIVYSVNAAEIFEQLLQNLGLPISEALQRRLAFSLSWAWVPALGYVLAFIVIRRPWSKLLREPQRVWAMAIGAAGLAIVGAYVIKDVFVHDWYQPLFAVPILFGLFAGSTDRRLPTRVLLGALLLVPAATLIRYSTGAVWPGELPRAAAGARVQRYLEVGEVLWRLFPDARLMTSEIGGLGYGFRGPLLDGVGLISPGALKHHPLAVPEQRSDSGIGAIPAAFVREEAPGLVVSYPIFIEEFARSPVADGYTRISVPAFSADLEARIEQSRIWGDSALHIYVRNDLADPARIEELHRQLVAGAAGGDGWLSAGR